MMKISRVQIAMLVKLLNNYYNSSHRMTDSCQIEIMSTKTHTNTHTH